MVGKECGKLPSRATVQNMNLQQLHLSHQHVGEVFATEKDSCLLTDETSRKDAKYMGYEASDSSGKLWVLGVREMASKSAADTLSVFKEILSDIDYTCHQSDHAPSKLILQYIDHSCHQSDHAMSLKISLNTERVSAADFDAISRTPNTHNFPELSLASYPMYLASFRLVSSVNRHESFSVANTSPTCS